MSKCKAILVYTLVKIMEKDLTLTELYDIYGALLTKRQRELFEGYFLYDLSLSEISEPDGKTRQSVFLAVKKVKAKLLEYEKTLKVKEKLDRIRNLANKIDNNTIKEELLDITNNLK